MLGPAEHPSLDPLWRRVVLVAFCAAWTGMEYYLGNMTWVYIVGGVTAYAAWCYLYAYKGPEDPARAEPAKTDENEG